MRRAKSNRRRVTWVTGNRGTVTTRPTAPDPDPLLDQYAAKHRPLPPRDLIREVMAAADAATEPVRRTGRCHTCDRKITGERAYCARCLAARQ